MTGFKPWKSTTLLNVPQPLTTETYLCNVKKAYRTKGNFLKINGPSTFYVYFCLFKQALQFLQQIYVKKRPSSIRCWYSNAQPSEHESAPITTRPGLLPQKWNFWSEKSTLTFISAHSFTSVTALEATTTARWTRSGGGTVLAGADGATETSTSASGPRTKCQVSNLQDSNLKIEEQSCCQLLDH